MKHKIKALAFLVCLSFAPTFGHAQTSDEHILAKAKEVLNETKNLVADTVETDMEMIDGDGKSMGTMKIQEKISGWADGEPVRTIIANSNPEHSAVAKSRFKVGVDNHPEKGLKDGTTLERIESTVYDGKQCGVFVVTGRTGKMSFKSKIWIEETKGLPLKVIHNFDGIPMTKTMEHTVTYGRSMDGGWVPVSAVVDSTVGTLFQKMRIVSKYRFLTWVKRPSHP